MNNSSTTSVFISKPQFEKLRNNERFVLLLRLARYVNQLDYCLVSYWDSGKIDTPSRRRQAINAVLFSAGVIYEALRIVPSLRKEFSHFRTFKEGFQNMWADKNTHFLREKILPKMRNGIVFHVDDKPIRDALQNIKLPEYLFLEHESDGLGNQHFRLADDIAVNYLLRDAVDDEHEIKLFEELMQKIINLITAYIKSANSLMADYAERKGWIVT